MKLEVYGQNEDKEGTIILRLTYRTTGATIEAVYHNGCTRGGGYLINIRHGGFIVCIGGVNDDFGFQLTRGDCIRYET
jgi:hypothetical protein